MNKYDLADPVRTDQWVQYYEQKGYFVAKVNSKNGKGVKAVHNVIQAACKEKIERDRRRGYFESSDPRDDRGNTKRWKINFY